MNLEAYGMGFKEGLDNMNKRIQKFKESPTFYIDFDNTLFNAQQVYCETYNWMFEDADADWTKNHAWDMEDVCPSRYKGMLKEIFDSKMWEFLDEAKEVMRQRNIITDMFRIMHGVCDPLVDLKEAFYYEGARDFIDMAVASGKAYVVTVGTDGNIENKARFLKETLHPSLHKLYIVKDEGFEVKAKIDMSDGILIDDRTDILHASNALYKVRFGKEYGWNGDWTPNNITTFSCETWGEVNALMNKLSA